jgi:hypothetical protein
MTYPYSDGTLKVTGSILIERFQLICKLVFGLCLFCCFSGRVQMPGPTRLYDVGDSAAASTNSQAPHWRRGLGAIHFPTILATSQ